MKRKKTSGLFWTASVLLLLILSLVRVDSADKTYWAIQVASYKTEESAKPDLERLKIRQFPQPRIEKVSDSTYPFKLVIGRFTAKEEGDLTLERVKSLFPAAFKRSFTLPSPPASPVSELAAKPKEAPPSSPSKTEKPPPSATKPKPVKVPQPLPPPAPSKASPPAPPPRPVPFKEPVQPPPSAIVPPVVEAVAEVPEETDVAEASSGEITSTIIPFEDLGYPQETSLLGSSPEFVFHLLNYKGLKRADAEIALRLSNVLSEKSTLTVKIDDVPQFTKSLKETGSSPRLSFPIPLAQNRHIKVAIAGHLFVSEDRCEDLSSGNLWMVVSGQSRLVLSGNDPLPDNISDFFQDYKKEINVILDPEKTSLEALPLFYYLHPLTDWKKINVGQNQKPSGQQKTIRVGYYSRDMEVKHGELLVFEEKIGLLKKTLQKLYITPSVSNAVITEEDRPRGTLRFSEMGIPHFAVTGSGNLALDVPLRYSFFSGIPKDLKLELIANHTPIPAGDKAFLTVSLNNFLLKAVQLENGGKQRAYYFDIPEELLDSYNNSIHVAASYAPNQGDCGGSAPAMTFSISNASRFHYASAARSGIDSVVDVMGSLSGKVLLVIDDRRMFLPGADLMRLLGQFNKDIRHIDVQSWSGQVPKGYDFVILLLNPESTETLDLPLKLTRDRFSIMNPITGKNLFGIARTEKKQEVAGMEYKRGFGVFQTFDVEDSKILLLSYYKEHGALEFLKTIKTAEMGRFNGNVVFFNQNIASYTVGDKFRVVYQEARSVPYYLSRFKLPIVLVGVLIVLLFLYYVNKRLVRE